MTLAGKQGKTYRLTGNPIGSGGEGEIYPIDGDSGLVAKIYKPGAMTKELEQKLNVMVKNPPNSAVLTQVAWPLDVLYDDIGACKGFVMPRLNITHELGEIYKYPPRINLTTRQKINIAQNICVVISEVHKAGYVFGDFNPRNIGLDINTGLVSFLDTDTYHVYDSESGVTHKCSVCAPGYAAPELLEKCSSHVAAFPADSKNAYANTPLPTFTKETDNFALGIHMFKLLMNGYTPFGGIIETQSVSQSSPGVGDAAVRRDSYCFKPGFKHQSAAILPLEAFPQEVADLFTRAFLLGKVEPKQRPRAEEWHSALTRLENNLKDCPQEPLHQFYNTNPRCPLCEADERFVAATGIQPTSAAQNLSQKTYVGPPKQQTSGYSSIQPSNPYSSSTAAAPPKKRNKLMGILAAAFGGVLLVAVILAMVYPGGLGALLGGIQESLDWPEGGIFGGADDTTPSIAVGAEAAATHPAVGVWEIGWDGRLELNADGTGKAYNMWGSENTVSWSILDDDRIFMTFTTQIRTYSYTFYTDGGFEYLELHEMWGPSFRRISYGYGHHPIVGTWWRYQYEEETEIEFNEDGTGIRRYIWLWAGSTHEIPFEWHISGWGELVMEQEMFDAMPYEVITRGTDYVLLLWGESEGFVRTGSSTGSHHLTGSWAYQGGSWYARLDLFDDGTGVYIENDGVGEWEHTMHLTWRASEDNLYIQEANVLRHIPAGGANPHEMLVYVHDDGANPLDTPYYVLFHDWMALFRPNVAEELRLRPPPAPAHTAVWVGDVIWFGPYEWRVLEVQGNRALVISEWVLNYYPHQYYWSDLIWYAEMRYLAGEPAVTWESSNIRWWLNNEFIYDFTWYERDRIHYTYVVNSPNPWEFWDFNGWGHLSGGFNTWDRIFLLSIDEVLMYFGDSGMMWEGMFIDSAHRISRPAGSTDYDIFLGGIHDWFSWDRMAWNLWGESSWWWLRSPGSRPYAHATVLSDGYLWIAGANSWDNHGIRPAMWIELAQ